MSKKKQRQLLFLLGGLVAVLIILAIVLLYNRHLARQEAAARAAGFAWSVSGYPAWPGAPDNPLALLLERVYREQTGRTLEISAVHVGLEPSIFQSKAPGLVMVSTGPEILDAHSVDERAPLHALPDYALLLAGFWEAL